MMRARNGFPARSPVVLRFVMLALGACLAGEVDARQDGATSPPVSGRRVSDPASILPADVLARVELTRANVELIRKFMGRSKCAPALLRADAARPFEVYSQSLNLQRRANRLAFEQVRVVRAESVPGLEVTRSADVFAVVDSASEAVLQVKRELGIEEAVGETAHPESTTPGDVFNAIVAAGSEINNLLRRETSPSDVFRLVTGAVHQAASLHATLHAGPSLPVEPAFEPDKTPADVYARLRRCFSLVREVAHSKEMETLHIVTAKDDLVRVTPNDVSDLAALLLEELIRLRRGFPDAKSAPRAYHPGRRFPAHVFQRAGFLEALLQDLARDTSSGE